VPDQRLILPPISTPIRACTKFTLAIAGTATALVAAASGAQAVFPASASAQPAASQAASPAAGPAAGTAASPAAGTAGVQAASTTRPAAARPAGLASAAALYGGHRAGPSQAGALDGSARLLTLASTRHRTPRQIARRMLRRHYSSRYQFPFLNKLWKLESGWNVHAENPYSGAYGIPQAVPGSKMSSAGPNWQNSARTQIRWGLRYIRSRYHSPRRAWRHEEADGWY
jgi:hypothetical protein